MDEALADHEVPADLLTLHEVLEWTGAIVPPSLEVIDHAFREMTVAVAVGMGLGWDERMVTRGEWGARPPRSTTPFTKMPEGVTAHWEGPRMGTFPHTSCAAKVRGIQAFHMDSRGWADIAYSAVVCPHGYIYEGRWAGRRTAANGTNDGNARSLAICYLSGEGDPWTEAGRAGFAECIRVFRAFQACGPKLWAHRDWKATACPGDAITADVRDGDIAKLPVEPVKPAQPLIVSTTAQLLEPGRDADPKVVRRAQQILRDHFGQVMPVTGIYDTATIAAVKNAQRFFGFPDTGVVNASTWKLLMEAPY